MRAIIVGLLFLGLTSLCFAQEDGKMLKEVEVYVPNIDYVKNVKSNEIHPDIYLLERKVAKFDVNSLNLDKDYYLTYKVLFFIPKGEISALYDNDSKIIRTIEKFNDVNLPIPVVKSVLKTYPDCNIESDVFLVTYHHKKGIKKTYKINVLNKDKNIKIKTDENGNIL